MDEKRPSLNPGAAPFAPKKPLPGGGVKPKPENKCEDVDPLDLLPDDATFERSYTEVSVGVGSSQTTADVSDNPSSSDTGHTSSSSDKGPSPSSPAEDKETNSVMQFLKSKFPGYSSQSLRKVLDMNHGNVDDTVYKLEQLKLL